MLGVVDKVAVAVLIGCVGGIGINTAHELGHQEASAERWLAKVAPAQSCDRYFTSNTIAATRCVSRPSRIRRRHAAPPRHPGGRRPDCGVCENLDFVPIRKIGA